tara:strand:+ start:648 stop:884 length:237 start_codon:yes stop_codon:yes gene_type:complete
MHNPSTPSDDHSDDLNRYAGQANLFVYCSACGKKKPDEIIFSNFENIDNIKEAFMGGNMITFKCKECNETWDSYVLSG